MTVTLVPIWGSLADDEVRGRFWFFQAMGGRTQEPPEPDEPEGQEPGQALGGLLLPVTVNGQTVFVPVGVDALETSGLDPLLGGPGGLVSAGEAVQQELELDSASDGSLAEAVNRKIFLESMLGVAAGLGLERANIGVFRDLINAMAGSAAPHASWAGATYAAVLHPMESARRAVASWDTGIPAASQVRAMIDQAERASLTSDYGALEQLLPTLIGHAEAASIHRGGDDLPDWQALCDVYAIAGWTLIKADHPDGAWIAAERAIRTAENADDMLRLSAATRCLAEVHMRAGNLKEASRTAFLAAVQGEGASVEHRTTASSLRGAALLSAAAASARRGDAREARAALKAAAACAATVECDRSELATVFGPTNVAIHQVAIAIELHDPREALRHIPAVNLERMPAALAERRARFLIDVARSHAAVRDDTAAVDALLHAEQIAPDELHHHRLTRQLIPQLFTRESRTSDLRTLAHRCGLLN
jgi:hypothetical protein